VEDLLEGRTAVVTGGGRGIGRAVAHHLAEQGARVIIGDNGSLPSGEGRDERPAREVAEEIVALGGEALAHVGDVTVKADAEDLIQTAVDRWGKLDILVNAAGNIRACTITDITDDDWDSVISTHLRGTFNTSHFAARHWVERGEYGRLVNFSSSAGINMGFPALLSYDAAKAGVLGLTKACANALVAYNVTANCVAPNAATRMGDSLRPAASVKGTDQIGGPTDPRHIAPLIAFLASPAAAHISGRTFGAMGAHYTLYSEPEEIRELTTDFLADPNRLYVELESELGKGLSLRDLPCPAPPDTDNWRGRWGHIWPNWDLVSR
jgi:NAD(P)-dependent dehydrogenase (short-subunit alcohol dehydrogenase family)